MPGPQIMAIKYEIKYDKNRISHSERKLYYSLDIQCMCVFVVSTKWNDWKVVHLSSTAPSLLTAHLTTPESQALPTAALAVSSTHACT